MRTRRRRRGPYPPCAVVTCAWLVLALLLLVHTAAAQTDADKAFEEGSAAFEAGDDQLALRKMRNAFKARADYRTAAGLGQVELHLARYRDAAEHLEFSLRHYPATGDPEGRELVMRGFAEARSHVVTLTLVAQVEGAVFTVDGEPVATLPVEHELFLDAGEHTYSFSKEGYEGSQQTKYFPAGSQHTLRVELRPAQVAPSATTAVRRRDSGVGPTIVAVGGALTLVGLGLGAGFHFGAEAAADDAAALREGLRRSGASCESGDFEPGCGNLEATLERSSNRQTISTVAFVGAAGAALTTLVAYTIAVLGDDPEPATRAEPQQVNVSHALGADHAWVGVGGQF